MAYLSVVVVGIDIVQRTYRQRICIQFTHVQQKFHGSSKMSMVFVWSERVKVFREHCAIAKNQNCENNTAVCHLHLTNELFRPASLLFCYQ